jgi:glycosyltransferase involved in cell wall biosynthesis
MRVLHVITRLIVGGAQENTIASVFGLGQKPDTEARLISGPTTGPEGSLESRFQDHPELLTLVPSLVRPAHPWKDCLALAELTRLFRRFSPDIVHTHSGKAGVLGRIAAHKANVPRILHTIHGPSFGEFQGTLPNLVFRAAERYAGRRTTHFISVADAMTRQYLEAGIGRPEQFTRIYSGFDLRPFLLAGNDAVLRAKWGLGEGDFVVGKIARFFKLKGHDDLLRAAPRMVAKCPRLKFLLVGDGVLRPGFKQQVAAMGLEKHFVFTGLVAPSEIPGLTGIMDAVVHLSRREGLARALPQALAAGKPVVAYDCDGAREVCLPNVTGFLVRAGELAALAASIVSLAEEPGLRGRLGQRGREWVSERFSVEKMVDDLYVVYRKLLTENPGNIR